MNLYISSDTGNSYIADAMNVPTINFAGPCFWQEQRPVFEKSLIVKSNVELIDSIKIDKSALLQGGIMNL